MKISSISKFLLTLVAVGALAACETTTTTTDPDPGPDPDPIVDTEVTTGTTDGEMSSNGLDFADGGDINPGDLDETALTLRAARLVYDEAEGDVTTAELINLNITNYGYVDGQLVVTVDMGGVTMLLDWMDDNCAVATDGNSYCVNWEQYSDNTITIQIWGEGDDFYAYNVAYAGFETDPDLLAFKGMANYFGGFDIELVVDDEFNTDVGGFIDIDADFGAATIEGSMWDGDAWDVDFSGEIAGNGWTATDDDSEIFGGDLEITGGDIQLDGVFYGAIGEETAGTIIVDVEVNEFEGDPEDSFNVTGAGAFIACESFECFAP